MTRICQRCSRELDPAPLPSSAPSFGARPLLRRTGKGRLGGVCSALAVHLGLDPLLVRVAFAAAAWSWPTLFLPVYLVFLIALPNQREEGVDLVHVALAPLRWAAALFGWVADCFDSWS